MNRNIKPFKYRGCPIFARPNLMVKAFAAAFFCISLILLKACSLSGGKHEITFFAMDTYMELTAYGKGSKKGVEEAYQNILELDRLLSNKDNESEISKINAFAGEKEVLVHPDTEDILEKSLIFCEKTHGVFDITIAPLSELWDIHPAQTVIPVKTETDDAKSLVNYKNLVKIEDKTFYLKAPRMGIDLGAVAKGYASDKAAEILHANGVKSAIISLGGNIYALGARTDKKPWNIGLRDPDGGSSDYFAAVSVRDKAVVTSGDYERYFMFENVRYHHILNPKTGDVARSGLRSVTVIADSGALADAYGTALFVMGLEKGLEFQKDNPEFEAVFVSEDKTVTVTDGIKDSFTFYGEEKGYTYEN